MSLAFAMPFEITVISFLWGVFDATARGKSIQAQSIPSFAYFREPFFLLEYVPQRHRTGCSVVPQRRPERNRVRHCAHLVTFDLFPPNQGKAAVKRLSSVVDQLSIVVMVLLNSL
jgi:hypothetical protein